MVVWLYRFIFGRLSIKFYGDFPEKALNLCAENGITLWNSKFKEGSIIANITVKDCYILR
ncbi:MAG: sporulation protein YqfD [Clostridia bacterium]|nr:sporulation protein YqfD [Clostridia bacterium]